MVLSQTLSSLQDRKGKISQLKKKKKKSFSCVCVLFWLFGVFFAVILTTE